MMARKRLARLATKHRPVSHYTQTELEALRQTVEQRRDPWMPQWMKTNTPKP